MTPTERAHAWQRHMTDWQASGVSGSAYCKQQSLVYHQFVYWRQKLTPTDDSPKQEQVTTGFARVVSGAYADTSRSARASATCNSLVETAKANGLEPSAYIQYVLERIAEADTLEKLEALLPWNVDLERASKKVPQID